MPNSPLISQQYQTVLKCGGFIEQTDREIIEIFGADRAAWLNNLITNVVKTLTPGEGNYAFAVNVKGRTIFDLNYLVLSDRLWLDVDRRWAAAAMVHLNKYIITEDVRLDILADSRRIAIVGPQAAEVVEQLGLGNLSPMGWLQHVGGTIDGAEARLVRNDFAGMRCADLILNGPAAESGVAHVAALCDRLGLSRVEKEAIETLRIEAGIPASVDDIDEDVVPPETGQIERGISYHKGCYLGQEVIERMRSHGILARKLVGVQFDGDEAVARNTPLALGDKEIGRTLSGCFSEALQAPLSLAYVKTISAQAGVSISTRDGETIRSGRIVTMPVRNSN